MAERVVGGFLRGPAVAGEMVGGLVVVNADGTPIGGGTGGGAVGTPTAPDYVRGTDGATAYDLARDRASAGAPAAVRLSDGTAFIIAASQADVQAVRDRLPAALNADGGLPTHVQNFPSSQAVTGPLTDAQLRATPVPVSGAFWQATQPVSGPLTDAQLRASNVGVAVQNFRSSSLVVSTTGAAAAAVTATLGAAGAGLFHYITSIEITLYSTAARTGAAAPVVVTSTNLPGSMAWTFTSAGAIGTLDRYQLQVPEAPIKASAANTATTIVAPVVTGGLWRINVTYYTAA